MNAINQATEHGYTHVRTLAGPVPLNEWEPLDKPAAFDPSEAALLGEWRAPSIAESMMIEDRGDDPAAFISRDRWDLS